MPSGVDDEEDSLMWKLIERWKPAQLAALWLTYWAGLTAVSLGPVIVAAIRAGTVGGQITGGLDNENISITVISKAGETIGRGTTIGIAAAWVVIPPLVLTVVWLRLRSRARRAGASDGSAALSQGMYDAARSASRATDEPRTPVPNER